MDKVKFCFRSGHTSAGMESVLSDVKETLDKSTGEVMISGKLKTLQIKQRGESWVGEGSLPKFGQGQNLFGMGLNGTVEVVEEICELFKVIPDNVDLWNFEFGTSLLVAHRVKEYLACLGGLSDFLRLPYERNGITYKTAQQIVRLYDKLLEMSSTERMLVNALIPSHMSALKIEVYLKRYAKAQLGWPKDGRCVSFAELCKPEFHKLLAQHWANKYTQIKKFDIRTMDGHAAFRNCRAMSEILQWIGMQEMGGPMAILDEIASEPVISKHVKRNMRNHVYSLASCSPGREPNPLICELDLKVMEVLNEVIKG